MQVFKYSFYCEDCAKTYEANFTAEETVKCQVNALHTIREGSVMIVDEVTPENPVSTVSIIGTDFKGRIRTVDTSRTDPYTWSYFTSAGDHPTNGIGEGADFSAEVSTELSSEKSISFLEDVEVHYGIATYDGMKRTDRVSVWVHAPATAVVPYTNGAIRLAKSEIIPGIGLNVLVPNPNGNWQFDESADKHPIPVEAYDSEWNPTGFWDRPLNPDNYDYSAATYTTNTLMQGQFNFYDFAIDLGWFVNNCRMIGNSSTVIFNNEDAFRCYKGWQMKLLLENGNVNRTTPAEVAVILKLNRKTIK